MFGIPDTVDHNRSVRQGEKVGKKGERRELQAPGTFWEYNDVRVNVLSVAALHVWREPLPDVIRREVMDPIGASSTWEWHPYDDATIEIDGVAMPSVAGGAHWGGGLWISALDHARFGQLWLRRGDWGGHPAAFRVLDRCGAYALQDPRHLWLHVVAEHRPADVASSLGGCILRLGCRWQRGGGRAGA